MATKEELEQELAKAERKIARLEKAAEKAQDEPKESSIEDQARAFKAALKDVPPEEFGRWKLTARALEEAVPEPVQEVVWS